MAGGEEEWGWGWRVSGRLCRMEGGVGFSWGVCDDVPALRCGVCKAWRER